MACNSAAGAASDGSQDPAAAADAAPSAMACRKPRRSILLDFSVMHLILQISRLKHLAHSRTLSELASGARVRPIVVRPISIARAAVRTPQELGEGIAGILD